MGIMTAGMHNTYILGSKGYAACFFYGKGINIGPQKNGLALCFAGNGPD